MDITGWLFGDFDHYAKYGKLYFDDLKISHPLAVLQHDPVRTPIVVTNHLLLSLVEIITFVVLCVFDSYSELQDCLLSFEVPNTSVPVSSSLDWSQVCPSTTFRTCSHLHLSMKKSSVDPSWNPFPEATNGWVPIGCAILFS